MSESMGGIISECPGDFIGIGTGQEDAVKKRADLAKEGFEKALANMRELADERIGQGLLFVPIPMKSPGHSEMMPPLDSDMMSPRARASLAAEVVPLLAVDGQSFLAGLSPFRRWLSPVRSMRWALWTRRSRIASA